MSITENVKWFWLKMNTFIKDPLYRNFINWKYIQLLMELVEHIARQLEKRMFEIDTI
jgi:hypothetical protein